MIPENLKKVIEEAKQELKNNPDGELILPIRKKIWAEMGEYRSEEGKKRRTQLNILCIKYAMPVWDYVQPSVLSPLILLNYLFDCYEGKISWEELMDKGNTYWTEMDDLGNSHPKYQMASLIGYAAIDTLGIARLDTEFGEQDEYPDNLDGDFDPYGWDASFYISGAVAGFKWIKGASVERRRQFWNWYLDKAVPEAYNAYR